MRKGWEYKRWKEVLTIINGKNQSAVVDENGEYPIYGSGGIMGYANNWLCPENCVIIGRKGNINKPIFVETKFWNVDTAFGLNANIEYLLPKFLFYFCLDYNFERHNKAVTIPSLTKADLLKIDIPLPPKSTQLAIVSELDKINELIRLKKEQLKDFDNLAQSLFYEMFGDPVENEKGWEVKKLGDVCIYPNKRIQVTELNPQDYVGVENLQKNRAGIVFSDKIPNTDSAIAFSPNDILIGNIRPYLKKIWLADKNGGASGDVVIIRICTNDLLPMYLYKVLASDQFFEYDNTYTKGAKMPRGDRKAIAKFMVPLPPLSLQHLFAQRIEQIEREKSEVQKSIQDLETLLASRMQYWFE